MAPVSRSRRLLAVLDNLEPRRLLSGVNFAARAVYSASGDPASICLADVTGDGKPDLITVDSQSGATDINILAGNGDGTFKAAATFNLGFQPAVETAANLVAADFNGDGKIDLLVHDSYNTEELLLGNGNGTFKAAVPITTETGIPLVADVNGDGHPDLVYQPDSTSLAILINNGDGTFAAPVSVAINNNDGLNSVIDLNGDGRADLVLINGSTVGIMLNASGVSFNTEVTYAAAPLAVDTTAVDINADHKPDLIVSSPGEISILLNNGNGTFAAPATLASSSQHALTIFSGDVNGDGRTDLIGIGKFSYASSTIAVFLGNGDGTFQAEQDVTDPSHTINSLVAADLNGDGKTDLALDSTGAESVDVLLTTNPSFATISNGILTITGTAIADSIVVTDNVGSVVATLNGTASTAFSGVTGIVITGAAGNDTITAAGVPIACTIGGGGGDDIISGGASADSLRGGQRNDQIGGAGGNDTIVGGGGNDSLKGGAGDDLIAGGPGNDTIKGGIGNDSINGGAGNDSVNGNAGNDTIAAGPGSSSLDGGPGVNTVIGSIGANFSPDTINAASGSDNISASNADSMLGQGGDDTVVRS